MNARLYTRNGYTFKRISKKQALGAFKNGLTVILSAVNTNPHSIWAGFHTINKALDYTEADAFIYGTIEKDFEAIVNAYEYYNCYDSNVGRYAAYYIPVRTVDKFTGEPCTASHAGAVEIYDYSFMERA